MGFIELIEIIGFSLVCFAVYTVYSIVTPPRSFPKNLPVIPFYVSFLTMVCKKSQVDLYNEYLREPLETHGAAIYYFASRWNILLQRPEYLSEMFRNVQVYEKSGNQKKVPYSVLADYTGDNIISSHGENWKLYRKILQPGLQKNFDEEAIKKNSQTLIDLIQTEQKNVGSKGIPVQQLLQRYTLANVAEALLNTDFETLSRPDSPLHLQQLAVKKQIFKPLFLNFPILDKLPIPSRIKARQAVHAFAENLCQQIRQSNEKIDKADLNLSNSLINAVETGILSEKQFRDNAVIVFVAGHENPQLFLTSILYVCAKYPEVQKKLREEAKTLKDVPLRERPYLNSVIYEILRMYPPISQLVNRKTSRNTMLGNNILIPKDTYVGYICFGTGHDPKIWGADAEEFRPDRWGNEIAEIRQNYLSAKSTAKMVAFHGGMRACLGEKLALTEIRILLNEIVQKVEWDLDPEWHEMMTPAGPLSPFMMTLKFSNVAK